MKSKQPELLPCPFCGSKPVVVTDKHGLDDIECQNVECLVQPCALGITARLAVTTWNTRTHSPVQAEWLPQVLELIEQYTRPDFYMWLMHDSMGQKSDPCKRAVEAKEILSRLLPQPPKE